MSFFQDKRQKLLTWLKKQSRGENKDLRSTFKSSVYAYGLYYGGWLLLVLVVLAVFSFTGWLGGPYVPAQVIFFLIAGTLSIIGINLFVFWRTLRSGWSFTDEQSRRQNARDVSATDIKDEQKVRDGYVIENHQDE